MKLNKLGGFSSLVAYTSVLALFAGDVGAMRAPFGGRMSGHKMRDSVASTMQLQNPVPQVRMPGLFEIEDVATPYSQKQRTESSVSGLRETPLQNPVPLAKNANENNAMGRYSQKQRTESSVSGLRETPLQNPVPLAKNANKNAEIFKTEKKVTEEKTTSQNVVSFLNFLDSVLDSDAVLDEEKPAMETAKTTKLQGVSKTTKPKKAEVPVKEEPIVSAKSTKIRKVKTPLETVLKEEKPAKERIQKKVDSLIFNPSIRSARSMVVSPESPEETQELEAIGLKVSALAEKKDFYKAMAEEYKVKAEQLEKEVGILNDKNTELQEKTQEFEAIESKVSALAARKASYKAKAEQLEKEVSVLDDKNAELQEKVQELDAIESKVSDLAERKAFYKAKAEEYKVKAEQLEKEVDVLNDKNAELEATVEQAKGVLNENAKLKVALENKDEELQEIDQQFSKLNDSCRRLIQNLEESLVRCGTEQFNVALDDFNKADTVEQIELLNGLIESVFATIEANKQVEEKKQEINELLDEHLNDSNASKDDDSDAEGNQQIENKDKEKQNDTASLSDREDEANDPAKKNAGISEDPIENKAQGIMSTLKDALTDSDVSDSSEDERKEVKDDGADSVKQGELKPNETEEAKVSKKPTEEVPLPEEEEEEEESLQAPVANKGDETLNAEEKEKIKSQEEEEEEPSDKKASKE